MNVSDLVKTLLKFSPRHKVTIAFDTQSQEDWVPMQSWIPQIKNVKEDDKNQEIVIFIGNKYRIKG